jgi:hypothetical protein
VALPPADGREAGFASVAGKATAAGEDDDTAAAGNSAALSVAEESFPCDCGAGGGRSSLDVGGIIMSNILSETLAHERRRFFFSSPETAADTGADCCELANAGAGADGDPFVADETAGCSCCVCSGGSLISVIDARFQVSTGADVGSVEIA